jgi:hypothetical protein
VCGGGVMALIIFLSIVIRINQYLKLMNWSCCCYPWMAGIDLVVIISNSNSKGMQKKRISSAESENSTSKELSLGKVKTKNEKKSS